MHNVETNKLLNNLSTSTMKRVKRKTNNCYKNQPHIKGGIYLRRNRRQRELRQWHGERRWPRTRSRRGRENRSVDQESLDVLLASLLHELQVLSSISKYMEMALKTGKQKNNFKPLKPNSTMSFPTMFNIWTFELTRALIQFKKQISRLL